MKRAWPNTLSARSTRAGRARPNRRRASGRLGLRAAGALDVEVDAFEQRPVVAEVLRVGAEQAALAHADALDRHAAQLGCRAQRERARLGAGLAQRATAVLHRQAARGHAFVGAACGARAEQAHRLDRHVELLGHHQLQRGQDALPQLGLAGEAPSRRRAHRSRATATMRRLVCRLPGSGTRPSSRFTPKPRGASGWAWRLRPSRMCASAATARCQARPPAWRDRPPRRPTAGCRRAIALTPQVALFARQPDALDARQALARCAGRARARRPRP